MYETALSTISVLPSTKEQEQMFLRTIKNEILANDKDPLPILVQLIRIERTIKKILTDEEIEYHFLKEFLLYEAEKIVSIGGAKLQSQETGVKYDYAESGDPIWNDLNEQITELTKKKKERETFLKSAKDGFVEPTTGVFVTCPPKRSKTKVVVKLS